MKKLLASLAITALVAFPVAAQQAGSSLPVAVELAQAVAQQAVAQLVVQLAPAQLELARQPVQLLLVELPLQP